MKTENYSDLEKSGQDGVDPENTTRFQIQVDDEKFTVTGPNLTGRQLLKLVGRTPVENHLVYAKLFGGRLEEIHTDKTIDLEIKGVVSFLTSKKSDSIKFEVDGNPYEWGVQFITGLKLKELAGVDPFGFDLWWVRRDEEDRKIANDLVLELNEGIIERFFTVLTKTTAGSNPAKDFLPKRDLKYLNENEIEFQALVSDHQLGIVFVSFLLPANKFNHDFTDFLVLLPSGYPEVAPDMFFCNPWIKLSQSGKYPNQADVSQAFDGMLWQRWSRHSTDWRIGKDGIWTMLKRIESSLIEA